MKTVATDRAPAAIGPYSQAVVGTSSFLFVSGQLPIDPATGAFISDDPVDQMKQCLRNLAAIAEAAGTKLSSVIKTTIFVTDLSVFAEINAAYAEAFSSPYPARSTVEVSALPKGAKVEVEAIIGL